MRNRCLPAALLVLSVIGFRPATALGQDAYMVVTAPGEDARTQMHVSWHSSVSGTQLEYTLKSDASYASSTILGAGSINQTQDSTTFSGGSVYRCHVLLDGLERGTDYIFRVGKTSFTGSHHFRTADGDGNFSFVFMSDIHAYPPIPSRVNTAVSLVSRAKQIQSNLDFILVTGDLTAHGANYTHWEALTGASFFSEFAMVTTPGNHDYYNSSAVTIDDRFYNAVVQNPANGATGAVNTTYWFKYDNTLFISLNTEANTTTQINAQTAWLREVVENNPAQVVIAYAHRAFFLGATTIIGGGVVRKSSDSYPAFGQALEEAGVDLVLAGHNHVYLRTKPIHGGEVAAAGEGTIYITANQLGDRGRMAAADLGEFGAAIYGGTTDSNSISTASIITVSRTSIDGRMFDAAGTIRDTYSIPVRQVDLGDFDKEAYANSFSVRVNPPDLTLGVLSFSDQGHAKVSNIRVLDPAASDAVYASFAPEAGMTQRLFGALVPGRTYHLTIPVTFLDDSSYTVHATLVNKLNPGTCGNLRVEEAGEEILLRWDNDLVLEEIGSLEVLVNSESFASLAADRSSIDIFSALLEGQNALAFRVVDKYDDTIFEAELEYVHAPGTDDGDDDGDNPSDGDGDGGDDLIPPDQWNVAGSGCGCSSVLGFFLFGLVVVSGSRRRGRLS